MDPNLVREVEAVLFASGRFLDGSRVAELVNAKQKDVDEALQALRKRYESDDSALRVVMEDGAWKLHVLDDYLSLVSRVVSDTEVSGPVLETLAVIAWRSPCLQSDVVDIRGSNAYEHIKELVDRGFIKKDPQGRTYLLRITEKFFEYFDIEGRDDIRKLFKEVEDAHRQKEMEVELEQKRVEQKIAAVSGEEASVEVQEKLPSRKVDLDKLDEVLEKSRQTRERVGKDLESLRPDERVVDDSEASDGASSMSDEEVEARLERLRQEAREELSEELDDGDESADEVREKAAATREQVERDADTI